MVARTPRLVGHRVRPVTESDSCRAMRRKLFTLAAGTSAVLCVAVCVLWVRSYSVADVWGWGGRPDANVSVVSVYGRIWSEYIREIGFTGGATRPPGIQGYYAMPVSGDPFRSWEPTWSFCGFRWMESDPLPGEPIPTVLRVLAVPHWALVLATGTLPGIWLVAWRRRHRRAPSPGRCASCGYDLRATPDRCPECGAVPAKGAAA